MRPRFSTAPRPTIGRYNIPPLLRGPSSLWRPVQRFIRHRLWTRRCARPLTTDPSRFVSSPPNGVCVCVCVVLDPASVADRRLSPCRNHTIPQALSFYSSLADLCTDHAPHSASFPPLSLLSKRRTC